jgi:hypothetical protein
VAAHCSTESLALRPGSARFRIRQCAATVDGLDAPACEVTALVGFDRCRG